MVNSFYVRSTFAHINHLNKNLTITKCVTKKTRPSKIMIVMLFQYENIYNVERFLPCTQVNIYNFIVLEMITLLTFVYIAEFLIIET